MLPRMRDRLRPEIPGGVFHVFARGNRKRDIFHTDSDRRQYLLGLALVAEQFRWDVLAWCLMRNHLHLLIRTPDATRSRGMQALHTGYARYYNDTHGPGGHVFQRPYGYSHAATDGDAMWFACYVLLNPVRAGLCDRPEDYPWSSLRPPERLPGAVTQPGPLQRLFGDEDRLTNVLDAVRVLHLAGFDEAVVMGAAGFEPATSRV